MLRNISKPVQTGLYLPKYVQMFRNISKPVQTGIHLPKYIASGKMIPIN